MITIIDPPSRDRLVGLGIRAAALARGFDTLGISHRTMPGGRVGSKTVACWGWRRGKQYLEMGHDVLLLENGYLGDRTQWTSLGWNGLNGRGTYQAFNDDSGARLAKVATLKPWKEAKGEYVLLLGQVPGDQSLLGKDMRPWYTEMVEKLKVHFGLPVVFRPHPVAIRKNKVTIPKGAEVFNSTLDEALSKSLCTVAFNSNSGVDSVVAGVPHICFDEGSMALEVSSKGEFEIVTPDRERWAKYLAQKQWQIDEIASGEALKELLSVDL